MTTIPVDELKSLVDKSGFPFQWAVEHEINKTTSQHGYRVESTEHAWKHPTSGETGFIDIVLAHNNAFYKPIIECKRPQGGNWIFLVGKEATATARLRSRWIWCGHKNLGGWHDCHIEPSSLESSVCIVRGQGEKAPTMIERLAVELLDSVEAVSFQEQKILNEEHSYDRMVYIPMIVTVARLYVCRVEAGEISLNDGKLKSAAFEETPSIRFRKSLTTELTRAFKPRNLQAENFDKERTVLVVNSLHLTEMLGKIKAAMGRPWEWPWPR